MFAHFVRNQIFYCIFFKLASCRFTKLRIFIMAKSNWICLLVPTLVTPLADNVTLEVIQQKLVTEVCVASYHELCGFSTLAGLLPLSSSPTFQQSNNSDTTGRRLTSALPNNTTVHSHLVVSFPLHKLSVRRVEQRKPVCTLSELEYLYISDFLFRNL